MEHIAALLLIIGCSQDMTRCEELPAPVPLYETTEECDAQIGAAIRELSGARDRVLATCVYVDPAMEEEDAELVWDVTPDGRIVASVEPAGSMVATLREDEGIRRR